ncbi:MAG: RecQ family ATP-dependent DNA helicase, partial [Planctomycetes bacterium]|nr:RecQ family ATP-dependent DNA helicase [Planctomycetota bacterium]
LERGSPAEMLARLEDFVGGARFLCGHNVLWHDLPWLARLGPGSPLLRMPVLDSLLLSPLSKPNRPYHALVKDYKLERDARNDPRADAELARRVLRDAVAEFAAMPSGLRELMATCLSPRLAARESAGAARVAVAEPRLAYARAGPDAAPRDADEPAPEPRSDDHGGHATLFLELGVRPCDDVGLQARLAVLWQERVCTRSLTGLVARHRAAGREPIELAYAAAWLSAADGDSVLPAWVRRTFPGVRALLATLRDADCGDPSCVWCANEHAAQAQLRRWFGYEAFRAQPAAADGASLQQRIVECGLRGGSLLGILPTGGGKSLCFQLPAIARHRRTGALTVVLSPLQALMKDQVENLEKKTGHRFAVAINGLLTPPERHDAMERVRDGRAAILYLSPEQLRSPSCARLLAQREIAAFVFDEAHCLAKWGHDFRPDYLYASRFIREQMADDAAPTPPIACLTATARREVRDEIVQHFRDALGLELELFEGGVARDNLEFRVELLRPSQKDERLFELVGDQLAVDPGGAVIVYCARRRTADDAAAALDRFGIEALAYHAGLDAAERKARQDRFVRGEVRVVCATNAFGMGIDKDDVRLVVHLSMPGSLENYLQEAGRAGRDGAPARCVLLHDQDDVEEQFRLIALSRLEMRDLTELWKALHRKGRGGSASVVVTAGELLRDEETKTSFAADERNAATRVGTALAWLERQGFLERNENLTSAVAARATVRDLAEARARIAQARLTAPEAALWEAICGQILRSPPDRPIDADRIAGLPQFAAWEASAGAELPASRASSAKVLRVLRRMASAGLVNTSTNLTAFVRDRVKEPSRERLQRAVALETALLALLRDQAPDAELAEAGGQRPWQTLTLRRVNQALLDAGQPSDVEALRRCIRALDHESFELRARRREQLELRLRRSWREALEATERGRGVASCVFAAITARIDRAKAASASQLVEFTYEQLERAIADELFLRDALRDAQSAIERALLWLHEQQVIVLQGGLSVFRRAMTIELHGPASRRVTNKDFAPLVEHYRCQQEGVHVAARYAETGAVEMPAAQRFVAEYFSRPNHEFLRAHFAGESAALARPTSPQSHARIVESLDAAQRAIVEASPERNLLVLAGPGSGKTRVVVHRCVWLLRVARAPADSLLLLCFNRATAHELRRRLQALVGDEARGVTIATYHGFAARLCGRSFAARRGGEPITAELLRTLIGDAVRLLCGETPLYGLEPDEQRDALLRGFRHILVDEYQDIDEEQYRLIAAIAGRGRSEDETVCLLAVGDDDQAIYGFRGANVAFLRRFETDYKAERRELLVNHRSTPAIVGVADRLIAANRDRLKLAPIRAARDAAEGDAPVAVHVLECARELARVAMARAVAEELARRLDGRRAGPREFAVLALDHATLLAVRAAAEELGIELRIELEHAFAPQALREVVALLEALRARPAEAGPLDAVALRAMQRGLAAALPPSPWWEPIAELVEACCDELLGEGRASAAAVSEFLGEALAEERRKQSLGRGVELRTVHGAKGLEFDEVLLCESPLKRTADAAELEERRRLVYVGMTRARRSLTVFLRADLRGAHFAPLDGEGIARRTLQVTRAVEALPSALGTMLSLEDHNLGFAGTRAPSDPVHSELRALAPGSVLRVVDHAPRLRLLAPSGRPVGELSKKASELWRARLGLVRGARVIAMLSRTREQSPIEYRGRLRVERWELPLVELIWMGEPDD